MNIKNSMYGGTVDLVFNDKMHRYTVDGKKVPSVTTILGVVNKPQLLYWAANMASDYFKASITPGVSLDEVQIEKIWVAAKRAHLTKKEEAAMVGTFVHQWVEDYINGKNPSTPVNTQVSGSIDRFKAWVKEHNVEFLSSEQPVFSKEHFYCGTADFFCKIDGRLMLGDLKTSNGIYYSSMGGQLAAYAMARSEEFPTEQFEGAVLVRVGKEDGEFDTWILDAEELEFFKQHFLYCLSLYKSELEIKQRYEE